MALISSGGGKLKLSAPKGLFGKAGAGIGRTGRHVARPPVHAAAIIKPPRPASTVTPGGPGAPRAAATPGASSDPFEFIKGLLQSTDPTQIRGLIDPVYAPLRQEIQNQISQLDATGKARADQMSQVYQAFEQYLGGMPAQIQSIYGQKGMQDGQTLAAGMAGPAGAVGEHLAAASNSGLMDELGKNWAAYAAAQPHIYALMATQSIKQMLNATQDSEAQLRSKLLDLSSQEAGKIIDYLESAQSKDQSLQEWAFQQKQSADSAKASQSQAYLNYLQKQRQIDFNDSIVQGKLTLAQAKAQADANYKAQLLQLKQAGLIDQAQYRQALVGLGQQRVGIAQQNANTSAKNANTAAGRAAAAKAAAGGKSVQANQKSLNTTLKQMGDTVAKLKGKTVGGGGSQSTSQNVYQKKGGGTTTDPAQAVTVKGKPLVVGHTTTSGRVGGPKAYDRPTLWRTVYGQYSRQLFQYYRALYPNMAKQTGAIQKLVEQRVTAAVGWGPTG